MTLVGIPVLALAIHCQFLMFDLVLALWLMIPGKSSDSAESARQGKIVIENKAAAYRVSSGSEITLGVLMQAGQRWERKYNWLMSRDAGDYVLSCVTHTGPRRVCTVEIQRMISDVVWLEMLWQWGEEPIEGL